MDFDGFRSDAESGCLARGFARSGRALDAYAAYAVGSYPASNPSCTKCPAYQDDVRRGIDYHAVLGVPETANEEALLSAFRARIRAVHPDLNAGVGDRETLELLVRARQTLTGPDRTLYIVERAMHTAIHTPASPPSPASRGVPPMPDPDLVALLRRVTS